MTFVLWFQGENERSWTDLNGEENDDFEIIQPPSPNSPHPHPDTPDLKNADISRNRDILGRVSELHDVQAQMDEEWESLKSDIETINNVADAEVEKLRKEWEDIFNATGKTLSLLLYSISSWNFGEM